MPNNITPPRVPMVDPKTGIVSREWFNFFLTLSNLTGSGSNSFSINDLLQAPPIVPTVNDVDLVTAVLKASATLSFPSTSSQTSSDLTISVPGAVLGDIVVLGVPEGATTLNSCYTAWVISADTVNVRYNNYSLGARVPASGTFTVAVLRF